jgi:hypothetical protein
MRIRMALLALMLAALTTATVRGGQRSSGEALRWFKGNTHTHTLNSDGDSTPDDVVRWYREQRYHFLVLSDHNFVTPVDGLNAVHGAAERFLIIHGEEVTDKAGDSPVHVNMLGGDGVVPPQGGTGPADVVRRDIDAIRAAHGVSQINHPNFGWALSAADLQSATTAQLLEIFNGHFMVNNLGGGGRPGAEALWDAMLTSGLTVFGVASDDLHELKRPWVKQAALPGQGWVVVRAARLAADAILGALAKGDFYASTGVELVDIQVTHDSLTVTIQEQTFARYTVLFIGKDGRLLKEAIASPARYDFQGNEGYVRAKVVDSNGRVAWTQPVRVAPAGANDVLAGHAR